MAGWVKVADAGNPIEMELVRGLLDGSGIPVRVRATGLQGATAIFGPGAAPVVGVYIIEVPAEQAETARGILAARPQLEEQGEQPEAGGPDGEDAGDR